jgi:isoprenylcysteine carboxyl methyltransferase (ICMT) family protein YpbQ
VAVVIEIAVIPLIFSCYLTSVLFTVLNLIALRRRIRIEESALLGGQSENETSTWP